MPFYQKHVSLIRAKSSWCNEEKLQAVLSKLVKVLADAAALDREDEIE